MPFDRHPVAVLCREAMDTEPIVSAAVSCTRLLVAFSGGADSAALLTLLQAYCREKQIPLLAVHVHHGIRGEEADRDAQAAATFCEERQIEYRLVHVDAPALSRSAGMGLEEAARHLRYEALETIADEVPGTCIATAHSADDNLETVLFRMVRGTALDGLCGIPPVRGRIIRPLLRCTAQQIRDFCREEGIPFVTDSTNADTAYARNYIRREIVPALLPLSPDPAAAVTRMCDALRADGAYLQDAVVSALGVYAAATEAPLSILADLPDALLSRAVSILYENAAHSRRNLTAGHIRDVMRFVHSGGYARLSLPGEITAVISGGKLAMRPAADAVLPLPDGLSVPLAFGENLFPEYGFGIRMERKKPVEIASDGEEWKNIYKLSIRRSIPSATIMGTVYMRFRRDGDTVRIGGMTRRVKKLMNEVKIPPESRGRLPVLCDDIGILWIPGLPCRDSAAGTSDEISFTYFLL